MTSTAQMGSIGPVFGANDFWTGMGIFMDSFDNDGQKNNPIIALMINDGTRSYDHQTDGSQQILASCQRDFRDKPFPIHLRIEYLSNVLTVYVDDGMQQTPRYELCMRLLLRFKQEHPDKAKDDDYYEDSKYFEDATARELRQLFEGQSHMFEALQRMEAKLNMIGGAAVQAVTAAPGQAGAVGGVGLLQGDGGGGVQQLQSCIQR